MQNIASVVMLMYSVLVPGKTWYAPDQPMMVQIKGANAPVTLVMMDFLGKQTDPSQSTTLNNGDTTDLRQAWPAFNNTPGAYIVMAVPKDKSPDQFVGTPIVVDVRNDKRQGAPPGVMVIKISPLEYATIRTAKGDMTAIFYYDVAPHTVGNFIALAQGGFYDGLLFHRIVPDFVIQTGDPRGDGSGGPGYHIEAEFNDREHREGVLSMARQGDPIESQGAMPRAEAANSAGSQFFICLNYDRTKQLDGRYTVFGKVINGFEVAQALGKVPTDPQSQKPLEPQVVQSIKIMPVTADHNPYAAELNMTPTTMPATTMP